LTTFLPSPDIGRLQSAIGGQCLGLEAILDFAQVAITRTPDGRASPASLLAVELHDDNPIRPLLQKLQSNLMATSKRLEDVHEIDSDREQVHERARLQQIQDDRQKEHL
jgi:hypothetical protein